MPWLPRGVRNGVLTSPYPQRPDGYGPHYRGRVKVLDVARPSGAEGGGPGGGWPPAPADGPEQVADLCPTGAISEAPTGLALDRGKCILCGRCVHARPDRFAFEPEIEVSTLDRRALVVPPSPDDGDMAVVQAMRTELARRVRALRRSVHVRHVDAGSDGAEEWEVAALGNPVYDVQRLGVFFTASPRHADLLLVTGAGAAGMAGPLRLTFEAMPDPKIVIAAGTDAISGGLVSPSYATRGGIAELVPVDVWVPGSPPSPFSLLHGILLGTGMLVPGGGRA